MCGARCLIGRGEASKGARCPRGRDVNWGEMSGSRYIYIQIYERKLISFNSHLLFVV